VVIAEDNVLLRDGLARLISSVTDFELVGACGSYDEVMATIESTDPDVVVTDTGVVVLSQFAAPAYAMALLAEGSHRRAYLLKDRVADVDDLVAAIRQVADGGAVIDPKVVEQIVGGSIRRTKSPLEHLTKREREIIGEMAQGKSNAAIAATLILSERAVEKHINSIFSKLHLSEERDVNRRVTAVLMYLTEGDADHTSGDVAARFPNRS
jgi:DNA-binding NarL/FixJ family response regulator